MSENTLKNISKSLLLMQIQQQRKMLGIQSRKWQLFVTPLDQTWIRILSFRRYLIAFTSLLALYNIYHPSRLARLAKLGVSIWGAVKIMRKAFESR